MKDSIYRKEIAKILTSLNDIGIVKGKDRIEYLHKQCDLYKETQDLKYLETILFMSLGYLYYAITKRTYITYGRQIDEDVGRIYELLPNWVNNFDSSKSTFVTYFERNIRGMSYNQNGKDYKQRYRDEMYANYFDVGYTIDVDVDSIVNRVHKILDTDLMKDVYDYFIQWNTVINSSRDYTIDTRNKTAMRNRIIKNYNITEDDFDSTVEFIDTQFRDVIDSVNYSHIKRGFACGNDEEN